MKWNRVQGPGDMVDAGAPARRGRGAAIGGGGAGLAVVIVVVLLQVLSGGKFDVPMEFDQNVAAEPGTGAYPDTPEDDELAQFTGAVAVDVQDVWARLFAEAGQPYTRAQVVRFRQAVETGCGAATSASGPFYCPVDQRVYLDMSFYRQMRDELGAAGDFAWAYVIAHEIGHHVQNLTGVFESTRRIEAENPSAGPGPQGLSVRTELQADCYAGVWGHAAAQNGQLEEGDLEEGLAAAEAVGDDRLQSRAGTVRPDSFTHGTSAQRRQWFLGGFQSGAPGECDTFSPGEV
ncbi:MAG: neutral zinc metallopeptidase [Solirubrobacteraceae bacterium]|nr:neutral zinc metallopeptidase [Solirubrobacteraceae bacterium]